MTGNKLPGVTVDTVTVKRGNVYVTKRIDGFGTMTDEQVLAYKQARPNRYAWELIAHWIESSNPTTEPSDIEVA